MIKIGKMDVSVIIVNYNTRDMTLKSISSVYEHTKDITFEVILVDNNSTDDTLEKVRLQFPEVIIIANTENKGFGRANNQGMRIAKGEYIFLLNSDAYILGNALLSFKTYMDKPENKKIAVVGGDVHTGNDTQTLSFGNFPSLFEAVSACGLYVFYRDYFNKHLSGGVVNYDDKIKEVDYITGADMFIRKSVLEEVGMFDEDFFMYFEDTELSFRIQKAGYKSVILPYIKIIHLVSAYRDKFEKVNYNKVRMFEKSRKMYYQKCYGNVKAQLSNVVYAGQRLFWGLLGKERGWLKKAWICFTT